MNSAESPPLQVGHGLVAYTHWIYGLHSLAVLLALGNSLHAVVLRFAFSLPSIIAVIMNYARRPATRGTYLESHFRWQIRTFWFALLWLIVIWAVSFPLMLVLVGFATFYVGHVLLGIWVIYRIARGWLALRDQRPMVV